MEAHQTFQGLYRFKQLPGFAKFLLENYLDEYVKDQLLLSNQLHLPLLKLFTHLDAEQLQELGKKTNAKMLGILADNRLKEHLEAELEKWAAGKHETVGRLDVVAEDITLINHIRQKVLKKWVPKYTSQLEVMLELIDEIDEFTFAYNAAATNTYITILTEKLEKNTRQLLEAQRIAQVGSFEWDFTNPSRSNSPQLREIFETEVEQSYEDVLRNVHPDDREKVRTSVEESMIKGVYDCEFRYHIDKREKVLWAKGIVHYKDEKPALMTGTVQDITERKKIEQNLLQKTLELELSNSNLEKFAYIASHDLQEPLRKILLHTDLLLGAEKERLSDRGRTLLDKVSASTLKMKSLIQDILTYSTLNSHQEKELVSIEDLLKEVRLELEHRINDKQAIIKSDQLPVATVFPLQIKQLLQNLIANSIKFSKKGVSPIVTFSHRFLEWAELDGQKIARASGYLLIEVTDNGIGFQDDDAQQIFALFKRLHSQKEFEGSGLGLAICRKVVENHGGLIEAFGRSNEGATFRIILPQ